MNTIDAKWDDSQPIYRQLRDRVVAMMLEGTLKEGEALLTIAPARPEQAVVLYVRAMDVPLLKPGRKVRLIFDGWPALQFAGWPSVSALKRFRSSGRCHGNALPRPMPRLRSSAAIRTSASWPSVLSHAERAFFGID
mgnify:CR=1 FL=1